MKSNEKVNSGNEEGNGLISSFCQYVDTAGDDVNLFPLSLSEFISIRLSFISPLAKKSPFLPAFISPVRLSTEFSSFCVTFEEMSEFDKALEKCDGKRVGIQQSITGEPNDNESRLSEDIPTTVDWKEATVDGLIMMVPQVYSDEDVKKTESFDAIKQNKGINFSHDIVGIALLSNKSTVDNVINFEMDTSPVSKQENASALESFENNLNAQNEDALVIRQSSALQENWWSTFQLSLSVAIFAIVGLSAIAFVVLLWLKSQMIQKEKSKKISALDGNQLHVSSKSCSCPSPGLSSENKLICHTVINLKSSTAGEDSEIPVAESSPAIGGESKGSLDKNKASVKVKAKGLLERRGSNASLTIDLPQIACNGRTSVVTPTRECMTEEFLLSAGNVLSRSQLRNCLKNVRGLHQEFWEIPLNHPERSEVTGCGTKNRYQSILPNERTRVKLNEKGDRQSLDAYINANYVRGYEGEEKAYIATQGPLPNTIEDLYRMAWNEKCPIIVMITKFLEKAKVKCESYFPVELNEAVSYGNFRVAAIAVQKRDGYTVRELSIENECEKRKILHYWYDTWPDHKTPQNAQGIVAMAKEIEKSRVNLKKKIETDGTGCCGPVIVHCSAGIGRTGCFIAISLGICQLLEEDKVDVLGIVCQMRCDRGGMIQTAEQYEFVHKAIALFERSLPEPGRE